jgi:CubicO group peptidase (beta-lactamase class C family)
MGIRSRVTVAAAITLAAVPGWGNAADPAAPGEAANPSRYSDADEAIYTQRFEQLMASFKLGLGLDSYAPLEAVPGARRDRPLPEVAATAHSIDASALKMARDYAARNNSLALLVWRHGKLEETSYFRSGDRRKTFPSRSLAKPLSAIAVGRAMALGHIKSLEQPVADFIGEWRDDPQRSKILVRHLLDMRSGLLPQAVAPTAQDILNRAYLHPQHEQILIHDYPIVDEPGTRFEYNNATAELVAIVIERATGMRYAQFISRELLQPIGALGGEVWINRPGGIAHSGCCMLLPAETWLRLGVLLLKDGVWERKRLLPEGFVQQMRQGTAQNPYYGLGVYVAGRYTERRGFANPEREPTARRVLHSEPYAAGDLFLFDGNVNQVVYIIPSADMVVLRVGDAPPRAAGAEWDNSFLPNTLLRGAHYGPGERQPVAQLR